MFLKISAVLLSLLIFITVPFLILAVTPIYIFRYIVAKTTGFWSPNLGKIISTVSTCMGVDDYSHPQWSLVTVFVVKTNISFEEFKERYWTGVLEMKNRAGEACTLEMRQYVTQRLGFLFWKWDRDFKLENHVHQNPGDVQYDVLNRKSLHEVAQSLVYKPYVPHRSPWEVIFLENFQSDIEIEAEPCKVVIVRSHHVLADGFSLLKLVVTGYLGYTSLDILPNRSNSRARKSFVHRSCEQIFKFFRWPYEMALTVIDVLRYRSNEWHVPESQLTRTMNSAMSDPIPVQMVKDIKSLTSFSFNAILMAAYAGGLRKFMSEAGYKIPAVTLCGTALPIANHPDNKLRNHATGVLIKLPTGLLAPLQRLQAIDDNLMELKTSTLPAAFYLSSILVGGLFAWMTKMFSTNSNTTAVASILPGPNIPWAGGGLTVSEIAYGGGMSRGNVGLGFSCFSYIGSCLITVAVDEGLVPKSRLPASKLVDYMIEELQDLKKASEFRSYNNQNA